MVNTNITLKCGHIITVNLPDDLNARAAIIKKYINRDCPQCRQAYINNLKTAKDARMTIIMQHCPVLKDDDAALLQRAEKIRHDKLSALDDMFDKLIRKHGFSSPQEEVTFNHYRQRTINRFCAQENVLWWINQQNIPVESIIEILKKETFVIEGKIFQKKDEQ